MSGSGPFSDDRGCQGFVRTLVSMRTLAGWSQPELAARCHFSKGVISNIESFQRAPRIEHGQGIDGAFQVENVFEAKARSIQRGDLFAGPFQSFPEAEKTTDNLFIWEHGFIPGLFQTETYARRVLERHPNVSPALAAEQAKARVSRQSVLTRTEPPPPRVWALMDESVLRRGIGNAAAIHDQLMKLMDISGLPNVTVQVVPGMESHVGLLGAFAFTEGPNGTSIVNTDDITDGRVRDEAAVVEQVRLTFRAMQAEALNVHDSRRLILKIAEDTWSAPAAPHGARALTAAPTPETA